MARAGLKNPEARWVEFLLLGRVCFLLDKIAKRKRRDTDVHLESKMVCFYTEANRSIQIEDVNLPPLPLNDSKESYAEDEEFVIQMNETGENKGNELLLLVKVVTM